MDSPRTERQSISSKPAEQTGLNGGQGIAGQELGKELSDFIEKAAVALNWVADDGTILWANDAELKLLGYSREEYVGQNIAKVHVDGTAILDILERLKRHEELHGGDYRVPSKE